MEHPVGGIERRMTDLIRQHAWASSNLGCICGHECFPHEHAPHVAGAVTFMLGLHVVNELEYENPNAPIIHRWVTHWERNEFPVKEDAGMTIERQELITRACELGVFCEPEAHTDQELRDAIAAEEASAAWLDRLEQLPTDEAKRGAVHRLAEELFGKSAKND